MRKIERLTPEIEEPAPRQAWRVRGICDHAVALPQRSSRREPCDRRAQVRLCRVPELRHQRVVLECLLDDAALNAFAAAVNQPHLAKAGFVRGGDVLGDDGCDIARRKGMEVERGFYRNLQDGYLAVTIVFMPPRTAKSPTTVMRLG
jgi:hypothetical protein